VNMLEELSSALSLFDIYKDLFSQDATLENTLADVFVDFISFWWETVRFLRRNATEALLRNLWFHVDQNFQAKCKSINDKKRRVAERCEALRLRQAVTVQPNLADLLAQLEIKNNKAGQSTAMPAATDSEPIQNIAYPKNAHFFGRTVELNAIRNVLDHVELAPRFRSYGLWGMGGIGKTQLALAYSHERLEAGVKLVLWINGEDSLQMNASYTEIADRLELEGRKPDASGNQNQLLVTRWLQKTCAYQNIAMLNSVH
jgi:predicted ATP-dependent serine protease